MLNRVEIIGHLGRDPELRYTPAGAAVANVSIATTEKWKDDAGEAKERTEWHRVVFFNRLAEIVGQYLHKGSLVFVAGKLTTRKWQDKDGQDRYTTEINASEMKMLGGKGEGGSDRAESQATNAAVSRPNSYATAKGGARPEKAAGGAKPFADVDDDIPF